MKRIMRYYYDTSCNKIEAEDIDNENQETHDEIAIKIINENPQLLEQYNKIREKGDISESVFLVMNGYIYIGGTSKNTMSAMYSSISLNDKTKHLLSELKQEAYYTYDIIRNELTDEQKRLIISWAKNGLSKDEIKNRVINEMIIPLAPTKNNDEKKNIDKEIDER